MDAIMAAKRGESPALDEELRAKVAERKARRERSLRIAARRASPDEPMPGRSDVATGVPVPSPPFWGSQVVKGVPLADYSSMLDERATFLGQWGLRGARLRTVL